MKITRQRKIIELINNNEIDTQEELAALLQDAGFRVTQATVSRDIRELGITKIARKGLAQRYVTTSPSDLDMNDKLIGVLQTGFISMDMAMNIIVIKTSAGMAMAVAAALDALKWNEIAGCIAGDDTIFCAIRDVEDTIKVMDKLKKIVAE
ncbi:MAG: arginine repressor [Clostridiales bacterium]|nr:arginine repressor [Clostridiales bacterium]